MKKKILIAALMAVGMTGGWSSHNTASAQTRKSITPLVRLSAQYDDNFYKTATNEINAWTYIVQPGLEAEVETQRSHLSLYYTLDAFFYQDLDEDLDFTGHTFKLDAGTSTRSDNLRLTVRDTFKRTRNAGELDYLINSVGKDKFSINRFDPEVLYKLGRSNIRLAYSNVWVEYSDNISVADSTENRGQFEYTFQLARNIAVGANYQLWNLDFDGAGNNYDSQQGKVVFSYQGSAILLAGGLGWHDRKFDLATTSDIDLFVWDGMLRWSNPRTAITVRLDYNLNDRQTDGLYYKTAKLSMGLDHDFRDNLGARLTVSYQNSNYEFIDREDDTWNSEAALDYGLFRWLTVSGAFGYQNRSSGVSTAEYDNFYGVAMLTFMYPIGTGSPVISPYNR